MLVLLVRHRVIVSPIIRLSSVNVSPDRCMGIMACINSVSICVKYQNSVAIGKASWRQWEA